MSYRVELPVFSGPMELLLHLVRQQEVDINGRISKCGDRLTRKLLFEAANVMLSRTSQACALKDWAAAIGRSSGLWEARAALARRLAVILHRLWIGGRGFDPKVTAMA